jgi:nucleotide-binding universal stress UspA family protein
VSRFFLGSHASKILRHAPVPVTLVPRLVPAPA